MKPRRNDPCPCGSGAKYKKCCGFEAPSSAQPAWQTTASTAPDRAAKSEGLTPGEISQVIALFNAGRYGDLESRARRLVARFPDSGFAWKVLGVSLQGQGKEALSAFQMTAKLLPDDAEAHNNLGAAQKDIGQLDGAVASCRRALAINPDFAEAHCNLGSALQGLGQLDDAVASYRRALMCRPEFAEAHNHLGNALRDLGQLVDAKASYRRAAEIKPDFAEAHCNLGNVLQELGQYESAVASYRQALAINANFAEAHNNLGASLQSLGQVDDAAASCRLALAINPDFAEAYSNLGNVLRDLGQLDDAAANCRRAIEIKPDFAEAHCNLGNVLQELGEHESAAANYRQAIEIKPDFAEAHFNLGAAMKDLRQLEGAAASYQRALHIRPSYAEAHCCLGTVHRSRGKFSEAKSSYHHAQKLGFGGAWVLDALMLPSIMGTRPEMMERRAEFERNLDMLAAKATPQNDPLRECGVTNFYLAYHGLNDRELQVKLAKYYEQACPSLNYVAPHCRKSRLDTQKKIRIGFLSKFLYNHSVSLCFSKIIETLSLDDHFEAFLISDQQIDEKIYSEYAGKRLRIPFNLARAREMLAMVEMDILVYLDIGMEPLSYFLAFSRLAPIQCVLGGHPVTTGITNIDYFLSADVMEPSDADDHYSEKLVLLPRPLFYFERPAMPATLKTRAQLGLPENRQIYMCPMRLQKMHPDFDEAIARILQIDSEGVVVLFEDIELPFGREVLEARFQKTILADVRERIIFLPWLTNSAEFISAIVNANVILDPFHFGIGSTAMITFAAGTPLITKAGEFMRGRVGMALCKMMDLPECIAEDTETYALKAVQIAINQPLRDKIIAKMRKNSHALYENPQPAKDLTNFFYSLAELPTKQS